MSDDISFQTWICPQCHYDHAQGGACAGLDPKEFTPAPEDKSYIAEQYRKLSARFDDALDVLRELQDVPCCKDAKYPGCRACAAIDFIVHANLERLVAKREKPVPDTSALEERVRVLEECLRLKGEAVRHAQDAGYILRNEVQRLTAALKEIHKTASGYEEQTTPILHIVYTADDALTTAEKDDKV